MRSWFDNTKSPCVFVNYIFKLDKVISESGVSRKNDTPFVVKYAY